jgi:hypothetical protein
MCGTLKQIIKYEEKRQFGVLYDNIVSLVALDWLQRKEVRLTRF